AGGPQLRRERRVGGRTQHAVIAGVRRDQDARFGKARGAQRLRECEVVLDDLAVLVLGLALRRRWAVIDDATAAEAEARLILVEHEREVDHPRGEVAQLTGEATRPEVLRRERCGLPRGEDV